METTDIQRHIDKAIDSTREHQNEAGQAWAAIAQAEAMLGLIERLDSMMTNIPGRPALRIYDMGG